ncbi:MAG: tetratricopeptide repeat protein [Deltaproteobacteria bacterium]|nr:tetratricopeptide repeat protein [Deltaproteobacteria bacterium]
MNSSETGFKPLEDSELRFLEHLIRTDPSSPALLALARTYLAKDRVAASVKVAQGVLDAHPDNLEAALLMAQAFVQQGQLEKAREALHKTSARLDKLAFIFKALARLHKLTGEADESARVQKAYQALTLQEDVDEEIQGLMFDLEPSPGEEAEAAEPMPTETLAALYLEQGLGDKAIEVYEKILDQDPGNERIRKKIIDLYLGIEEHPPVSEPMEAAEPMASSARERLIEKLQRLQLAAQRRREAIEASF